MTVPFDAIIACGDSYTEGCRSRLNITVADTWPGLVAKHFGVPVVNLARGGASNYEIALQPVQPLTDSQWPKDLQKPLLLFTFTHDYRMPYYDFDLARIHSFFSIDSQRLHSINKYAKPMELMLKQGLAWVENRYRPDHVRKQQIDGYQHQTHAAIDLANSYTRLVPQAMILWGFGHCHFSEHEYDLRCIDEKPQRQYYGYLDRCYNEDLPLRRPLQWLSDEHQLWISQTDIHPNRLGIEAYAQAMIKVIAGRFCPDP